MINCADYLLPDHHVNILTKINILIDNSKYTEYQKKTFMLNA